MPPCYEFSDRTAAQTRTHWLSPLRQIAKMIGRLMGSIAALWAAARFPVERLRRGRRQTEGLANYKTNACGVDVIATGWCRPSTCSFAVTPRTCRGSGCPLLAFELGKRERDIGCRPSNRCRGIELLVTAHERYEPQIVRRFTGVDGASDKAPDAWVSARRGAPSCAARSSALRRSARHRSDPALGASISARRPPCSRRVEAAPSHASAPAIRARMLGEFSPILR